MTEPNDKYGQRIIIVSGPSGVGKSTICREVVKRTGAFLSVSMTTRTRSGLEKDGEDYIFVSEDKFKKMLAEDGFLEHAEVFGNYYGTPKQPVVQALEAGQVAILEIDVQGGLQVKTLYKDAVMVFILPPTQHELQDRINGRGRGEDEETARRRIEKAGQETAMAWQHYDHMVINADLEQAINEVVEIVNNIKKQTVSGE